MSWKLDKVFNGKEPTEVLEFEPVVVTLSNGDLVLCELAEIDENNYCMMTPFRMIEMDTDDDEMRLQAVRLVPGSIDIFFHIAASQVVTAGYMTEEMFAFFVKAVDRMIESMSDMLGDGASESEDSSTKSNILAFQPKGTIVH